MIRSGSIAALTAALLLGCSTGEAPTAGQVSPASGGEVPPADIRAARRPDSVAGIEASSMILDEGPIPQRRYSAVVARVGDRRELRLELRETPGAPVQTLDVVPLPEIAHDQVLLLDGCERQGAYDPEIVAIVGPVTGERDLLPARQAWRLDRGAGAIEDVQAGVRCMDSTAD